MESRSEEARNRTIEVPNEIAACADEVELLARKVRAQLTSSVAGDAEAAEELARAAARVSGWNLRPSDAAHHRVA